MKNRFDHIMAFITICIFMSVCFINTLSAQTDTMNRRLSFHFQQTSVYQWHYGFAEKYHSDYSLSNHSEDALSLTSTIFVAAKLWKGATLVFNPELAGGIGLSSARGIAGFTNGETFRIGDPRPQTYIARAFIEQKFALDKRREFVKDGANTIEGNEYVKYISVVAGKFSNADYFDRNKYSHDPRTQFLNWSLMNTGAWDYAANTRGYTYGIVLQYISPDLSVRYGFSLEPVTANGPDLDGNFQKYNAQTVELEKGYMIRNRKGIIRITGFYNLANMASYNTATALPDSRREVANARGNLARNKYGASVNLEQSITDHIGLFSRMSWNDGQNETWAFTEIDQSVSAGISIDGKKWKRGSDVLGFAVVANGISQQHQEYLRRGGKGFMIGDGTLNYAPEMIAEIYYAWLIHEDHFWLTPDYQFVVNPAYNKDRGPANVFAIKVHAEF